ncbi:MAG: acyl-ACP--UDP-N-acetylglucosamine O-acyltransferase [Planctomycetota bacterium]|nr:acyl-ACP--UDP-N-acetylglucosamine O-acyltransferase [Planctomycetota bacterium]
MATQTAVEIHPTAVVDSSAELGDGVRIGPYCVVGRDVRLGAGTTLHNHVTVQESTVLGEDCVIYPYAVLGAEPQDLKYLGGETALIIGDRVRVREHATIHRGTEIGGGKTVVGSDCLIMVGAHIAHDCVLEDQVIVANGVMMGGHCLVEMGATIAGGAGIHHFASIGRLAFVGGMARISKDVPPFLVVEGNPAEPRKVNTTALVRRGWSADEIEGLRGAFKQLFRNPAEPMQSTMHRLRTAPGQHAAVLKLCDALEASQLGVHGRWREMLRGD